MVNDNHARGDWEISDLSQLTPKQAKFYAGAIKLGNYTKAYRTAYDADNMSQKAVGVEACRLAAHPIISLALEKAKRRMAQNAEVTAETILEELEEARLKALEVDQVGAAVSASAHKAKLLGLNAPEKREQVNIDGTPQDLSRKVETARKALEKPTERKLYDSGRVMPEHAAEAAREAVCKPTNGSGTTEPHKTD